MKWLRTIVVVDKGDVLASADWACIHDSYVRAIQSVDFPIGSGSLTLRRKSRGPDGKFRRNGVNFLKSRFLKHIVDVEKWRPEVGFDMGEDHVPPELKLFPGQQAYQEPITSAFGSFDLVTTAPDGTRVAIEWETGNISSSHRSMNKLAIALMNGAINAGVLIVPSRLLYEHLTDRIGNISELSGYLAMWRDLDVHIKRGVLAISVVEHDALTDDPAHSYLRMGNDGRAAEGRSKKGTTPKRASKKAARKKG